MTNFEIKANGYESIDSLVQKFKRATSKSGVLADFKRHKAFVSKSERRKVKRERSLRAELANDKRIERYLRHGRIS